MSIRLVAGTVAFGILAGCSTTYPVIAINERTNERYFGTATSAASESTFELSNASGTTCTGTYKATVVFDYTTGTSTRGKMNCSDGKSGTWVTSGTAYGGQGEGRIGKDKIKVYYGQFAARQQLQ
mgnify:CR=1 FL=1